VFSATEYEIVPLPNPLVLEVIVIHGAELMATQGQLVNTGGNGESASLGNGWKRHVRRRERVTCRAGPERRPFPRRRAPCGGRP